MIGLLIFIAITILLLIKLNDILGIHIGFKADMKDRDIFTEDSSIEEINKPETQEIHGKIKDVSDSCPNFDRADFIDKAKQAFEIIFEAYAKGNKRTLKDLLAPRIYDAFVMAIDDRNSRGETQEGILVRFVSADIVDTEVTNDDIRITIKFVTEQSNVLKSKDGKILEGNSDFVETRVDFWVFYRKKSSSDIRWFLYEIKDESE
jgi:predicted lipid-binding transport protein (Tim44 family)